MNVCIKVRFCVTEFWKKKLYNFRNEAILDLETAPSYNILIVDRVLEIAIHKHIPTYNRYFYGGNTDSEVVNLFIYEFYEFMMAILLCAFNEHKTLSLRVLARRLISDYLDQSRRILCLSLSTRPKWRRTSASASPSASSSSWRFSSLRWRSSSSIRKHIPEYSKLDKNLRLSRI